MGYSIIYFFYNWVKANYIKSSVAVKRYKHNFTIINLNSLIPISNQFFAFWIHVEQVLFFVDPKEKRWKVVLCKDPHGKQIIGGVDSNPIDLDMF
jgi:hypothetical protein